jgi:hypothetical protein
MIVCPWSLHLVNQKKLSRHVLLSIASKYKLWTSEFWAKVRFVWKKIWINSKSGFRSFWCCSHTVECIVKTVLSLNGHVVLVLHLPKDPFLWNSTNLTNFMMGIITTSTLHIHRELWLFFCSLYGLKWANSQTQTYIKIQNWRTDVFFLLQPPLFNNMLTGICEFSSAFVFVFSEPPNTSQTQICVFVFCVFVFSECTQYLICIIEMWQIR